jgi:DNA-binding NarL/FixJ family response regulator
VRVVFQLNSGRMNKQPARVGPKSKTSSPTVGLAPSTRLFVVDDHPAVRHGLRFFLGAQSDLTICGEAEGEDQALASILELQPDLAVVDLNLKEGSGLSLIQRLQHLCPAIRILVFSACSQVSCAADAFSRGAHGYVTKEEGPETIVEAIHALLNGRRYLSRNMRLQGFLA